MAELNRNGLFTRESQPGLRSETAAQREYVTGFCNAGLAAELLALSTRSELVAVAHAPGDSSNAAIPVTTAGTEVTTVLGSSENPVDDGQIRDWADETNDSLALLLADSWYVEILDPVWGRTGVPAAGSPFGIDRAGLAAAETEGGGATAPPPSR